MRVFYPISARLSDWVNEPTTVKSGWMSVWSVLTIVVITIVSSNLSLYEGGAAERQHEAFTQKHDMAFENNIVKHNLQLTTQS